MVLLESDEASIQSFLGDLEPNFPIVKVEDAVPEAYDVRGIPLNILVAPDGTIVERVEGAVTEEEWERRVVSPVREAATEA